MSPTTSIKFLFTGWYLDTNNNVDKILTIFSSGDRLYAAKGGRGKKLTFSEYNGSVIGGKRKIREMIHRSVMPNGDYQEINIDSPSCMFAGFKEDVERQFVMYVLKTEA